MVEKCLWRPCFESKLLLNRLWPLVNRNDEEKERARRNDSMLSGQKPTKDNRTFAFKRALITAGITYK